MALPRMVCTQDTTFPSALVLYLEEGGVWGGVPYTQMRAALSFYPGEGCHHF